MPSYTVCPTLIEHASKDLSCLHDILYNFIPDNSKKICFDSTGHILKEYLLIAKSSKEILDWLDTINMRPDATKETICIDESFKSTKDLLVNVCKKTFDKKLIATSRNHYADFTELILKHGISLYDKELAKAEINYGPLGVLPSLPINNYVVTEENLLKFALEICANYKALIENNGWYRHLHKNETERFHESVPQSLFYGVAISYCEANNLKISPESNAGVGPVDFNISRGKASINIEVKYADNSKLTGGLVNQLEAYNRAERTETSIYLVLFCNDKEKIKIQQLNRVLDRYSKKGLRKPEIFPIDARLQVSASKRT